MLAHPRTAAACLLAAALCLPALATAGGFEVGVNGARAMSRGGAFTARADDGSAIDHNPGGLINLRGKDLYLSHNTLRSALSFTRGKSVVPGDSVSNVGEDALLEVSNEAPWFALGAMAVFTTDLGTENWRLAVGAYGPSASGYQRWPVGGGQRYMLQELDVLLAYYSAAITYGEPNRWGVGVTLQYAHLLSTNLSLVTDATLAEELNPYYGGNDVLATLSLSDPFAFTAIVGFWMRLTDSVDIGLSGRILPARMNATGDISLTNTPNDSQFSAEQLTIRGSGAALNLVIPPSARAGVRYRSVDSGGEVWDVELDVVYEAWSMMKEYAVDLQGTIQLFGDSPAPDLTLSKAWSDTVAVRLGGTWNAEGGLSVSAGGFYESAAVPLAYTHVDFPSFERYAGSFGVGYTMKKMRFQLGYTRVYQPDRTVDEATAKLYQVRPLNPCPDQCGGYDSVPANAGTFKSAFDIFSLSANVGF